MNDLQEKVRDKLINFYKILSNNYKGKQYISLQKKYHLHKSSETFHLFKFESGLWTFNKEVWTQFVTYNKIDINEVLYWILLPPICTQNPNTSVRDLLIKTIFASKELHQQEDSSQAYVEISCCTKINEIQKKFGLNRIINKNEKIAFIQIRYSPSLENNRAIENMQAALTLISDYIILIYDEINLNDSAKLINNSINKAKLNSYFKQKKIGLMQLFVNIQINFDREEKKINHNPEFQSSFNDMINNDKEVFNIFKKIYKKQRIKMQMIDIIDFETYNIFLETIINFCQNNTSIQNIVKKQFAFFSKVHCINESKDDSNFASILDYIIKIEKIQSSLPILHFDPNKKNNPIIFNEKLYNQFLSSNNIDKKSKSLNVIVFIYSNPKDMNLISKVISEVSINDANSKDELLAQIKYCGILKNIGQFYHLVNNINHLAFISITTPKKRKNYFNFLLFVSSIVNECNVVITIANKSSLKKQLFYFNKLKNIIDYLNINNKQDEKEYIQQFFVVNGTSINENETKEISKNLIVNQNNYLILFINA